MGNCAGYCNGQNDGDDGHDKVRQSFNKQDMMNNQHNDFENRYGGTHEIFFIILKLSGIAFTFARSVFMKFQVTKLLFFRGSKSAKGQSNTWKRW